MSSHAAHQHQPGSPSDRLLTAVGDLYDEHGAALYRLALSICQDIERASVALVEAFHHVLTDSDRTWPSTRVRHDLARLTYRMCVGPALVPPDHVGPDAQASAENSAATAAVSPRRGVLADDQLRALWGLTFHGDHTYDEAAEVLHVDREVAASGLRIVLRERAREASA